MGRSWIVDLNGAHGGAIVGSGDVGSCGGLETNFGGVGVGQCLLELIRQVFGSELPKGAIMAFHL